MAAQSAWRWPRVSLERPRAGRASVPGSARPGDHAARPRLGRDHRRVRRDLPARRRRPRGLVLRPRRSTLRAAACLGFALAAQLRDPELVPAMLQWYYCVAAVYSLLMTGWRAAIIGPLAGVCYFVQVLLGSAPVPLAVALLRSAVLAALGLVMYLAGRAYRQARSDAEHTATHDALTDLPNRDSFLAAIEHAMADGTSTCTVLVFDVDRFKSVNDALGHATGDRMLVAVARRLADWASARHNPRTRWSGAWPGWAATRSASCSTPPATQASTARRPAAARVRRALLGGGPPAQHHHLGRRVDDRPALRDRDRAAARRRRRALRGEGGRAQPRRGVRLVDVAQHPSDASASSRTSAPPSAPATSGCTSSRSSASRPARSAASRPSPAGPGRATGRCRRTSSSASPRRSA